MTAREAGLAALAFPIALAIVVYVYAPLARFIVVDLLDVAPACAAVMP